MEIEVIYIGDRFYEESQTMMSPLYLTDGTRYNWGFMEIDLEKGHTVKIRQASHAEKTYYNEMLDKIKSHLKNK